MLWPDGSAMSPMALPKEFRWRPTMRLFSAADMLWQSPFTDGVLGSDGLF
jgi:hypothetical protein